ncbi:hypothetical protein [Mycolicibacterium sp. J2]|jgi:hypothetical protein|uniref:hypothetical protein n=1 Tax=Mycolicibacterium sp. J2 TaxID=2993511 RepID=UPI00224AC32A|nr:hypothetical protein [Mycolicibacterium sp. J2]MCX2711722.1 hypothetical protein [Mycolicibacterium sp. J2]
MASSGSSVRNWVLALATLPAAAAVVGFAYLQIMGTAGCSEPDCARLNTLGFTLIQYGVPAVAALAVVASFVTARRRGGVLVPVAAWAVILLAVLVLIVSFPH